ncbi:MAG: 50S ribosomal protein L6 [Alphaproteobacteria bacterium]|nr:50S ribosomal protein L6 [Alphaproteobacteria bacterium]
MSRLARNPVPIPGGVTVEVNGQDVKAKGPKGELALCVHDDIAVTLEEGENGEKQVRLKKRSESRQARMLWGTTWSNIRNIMAGVKDGYTRNLELQGVGYRANMQGNKLVLQLGYSHDVEYAVPEGIKMEVEKQTKISISGIDKQRVGQIAAEIRSFRKPEPYKGKGVRYENEYIFRKEGKKK